MSIVQRWSQICNGQGVYWIIDTQKCAKPQKSKRNYNFNENLQVLMSAYADETQFFSSRCCCCPKLTLLKPKHNQITFSLLHLSVNTDQYPSMPLLDDRGLQVNVMSMSLSLSSTLFTSPASQSLSLAFNAFLWTTQYKLCLVAATCQCNFEGMYYSW